MWPITKRLIEITQNNQRVAVTIHSRRKPIPFMAYSWHCNLHLVMHVSSHAITSFYAFPTSWHLGLFFMVFSGGNPFWWPRLHVTSLTFLYPWLRFTFIPWVDSNSIFFLFFEMAEGNKVTIGVMKVFITILQARNGLSSTLVH